MMLDSSLQVGVKNIPLRLFCASFISIYLAISLRCEVCRSTFVRRLLLLGSNDGNLILYPKINNNTRDAL